MWGARLWLKPVASSSWLELSGKAARSLASSLASEAYSETFSSVHAIQTILSLRSCGNITFSTSCVLDTGPSFVTPWAWLSSLGLPSRRLFAPLCFLFESARSSLFRTSCSTQEAMPVNDERFRAFVLFVTPDEYVHWLLDGIRWCVREEAAAVLECPEIAVLVYPLNCSVLDPFIQALGMTISTIFFFDGVYKPSDVSINSLRQSCPFDTWSVWDPAQANRVLAGTRWSVFPQAWCRPVRFNWIWWPCVGRYLAMVWSSAVGVWGVEQVDDLVLRSFDDKLPLTFFRFCPRIEHKRRPANKIRLAGFSGTYIEIRKVPTGLFLGVVFSLAWSFLKC